MGGGIIDAAEAEMCDGQPAACHVTPKLSSRRKELSSVDNRGLVEPLKSEEGMAGVMRLSLLNL
jgi:hypothetical protein